MSGPISDDELAEVEAAYLDGKKIEAIKLYRQATGAGLAEAKQFVEALDKNSLSEAVTPGALSDADVEQIQSYLFAGQKIAAIKRYRTASGGGLKEAKDFIDSLESALRQTDPTKFTAPPAKGCGTTVLCALLVLGIIAAWLM